MRKKKKSPTLLAARHEQAREAIFRRFVDNAGGIKPAITVVISRYFTDFGGTYDELIGLVNRTANELGRMGHKNRAREGQDSVADPSRPTPGEGRDMRASQDQAGPAVARQPEPSEGRNLCTHQGQTNSAVAGSSESAIQSQSESADSDTVSQFSEGQCGGTDQGQLRPAVAEASLVSPEGEDPVDVRAHQRNRPGARKPLPLPLRKRKKAKPGRDLSILQRSRQVVEKSLFDYCPLGGTKPFSEYTIADMVAGREEAARRAEAGLAQKIETDAAILDYALFDQALKHGVAHNATKAGEIFKTTDMERFHLRAKEMLAVGSVRLAEMSVSYLKQKTAEIDHHVA